MRAALIALLLLSGAASAQTQLGNVQQASGGGFVQVSQKEVDFDLGQYDFPVSPTPSYYPPVKGSPFDLLAGGPTQGTWVLDIRMMVPLGVSGGIDTIPPQQVEFKVEPRSPGKVAGCVGGPWTPIGGGARVVVFQGPGICRLTVSLRIKATGAEAPGPYQGTVAWSLRRDGP